MQHVSVFIIGGNEWKCNSKFCCCGKNIIEIKVKCEMRCIQNKL